jgi:hypothetical protein
MRKLLSFINMINWFCQRLLNKPEDLYVYSEELQLAISILGWLQDARRDDGLDINSQPFVLLVT